MTTKRKKENRQIPVLHPGKNCWTANAPIQNCGLLIDARQYYKAFYEAACAAQRYILIAGWKFNSDVRLVRGSDAVANGGEVKLLPLLQELCDRNPELRVNILAWDFSAIYALEWEWFLDSKFRNSDGRLQFRFDSNHPFGASHHQKFVIIDGHTAFVGGLDFNADDWDDRDHRAENPDRGDSGMEPHGPYHDIQACFTGPAALEVAEYFDRRWQAAGYEPMDLTPTMGSAPVKMGLPIHSQHLALSRNESQPQTGDSVLEIRELYTDAINAAERLIYIENQYFSADAVAAALERRMRQADRPRLDIIMVLPKQLAGTLESVALEPPRLRLLDSLTNAARQTGHRLGVYYSTAASSNGNEVTTLIHSKLMIVDDRFLTVGSANISNRSMGLDSELNVSWEALKPSDSPLRKSIRNVRLSLLSEHCGFHDNPGKSHELNASDGSYEYLDALASTGSHRLRCLTREEILDGNEWLEPVEKLGISLDPETTG